MVYSSGRDDRALRVLRRLAQGGKAASVVVIAEEPDFGEYVDLMNRGAAAYFSLEDPPATVAQALKRTSRL